MIDPKKKKKKKKTKFWLTVQEFHSKYKAQFGGAVPPKAGKAVASGSVSNIVSSSVSGSGGDECEDDNPEETSRINDLLADEFDLSTGFYNYEQNNNNNNNNNNNDNNNNSDNGDSHHASITISTMSTNNTNNPLHGNNSNNDNNNSNSNILFI